MTVRITCPICGGEVLLEGEESRTEGKKIGCYLCEPCDHAFKADEQGNIVSDE
jgi:predicted RNA-binding Zn-ribbon protein involved in translation (DUF1610 family)